MHTRSSCNHYTPAPPPNPIPSHPIPAPSPPIRFLLPSLSHPAGRPQFGSHPPTVHRLNSDSSSSSRLRCLRAPAAACSEQRVGLDHSDGKGEQLHYPSPMTPHQGAFARVTILCLVSYLMKPIFFLSSFRKNVPGKNEGEASLFISPLEVGE